MSRQYLGPQSNQTSPGHLNHHPRQQPQHVQQQQSNRNRRMARLPTQQFAVPSVQLNRVIQDLTYEPPASAFQLRFEAGRSFDLDDDFEFCPGLLSEDDYQSVSSASSDRSSMASSSPELSPTITHTQPSHLAAFTNFNPSAAFFQSSNMQPQDSAAGRQFSLAPSTYPPKAPSPAASVSPARIHQAYNRRW